MDLPRRAIRGVVFISVIVLLCASVAYSMSIANYKPEVKGIHWASAQGYTRVVIDLTKSSKFSHNRIKNPERIYVDLERTVLPPNVDKTIRVADGAVERVRVSHFNVNTVRVVLDLKGAERYEAYPLNDPARIVIDVFRAGGKVAADSGPERPETKGAIAG